MKLLINYMCHDCVQPVMMYGAALWGHKEYNKLNTVQNRACKFFLGVSKTASNMACHGDMGWLSVEAKQKIEMVRLYCRLHNMDKSRLTYNVFKWSKSLSLSNTKTWEFYVKKYLLESDMQCVTLADKISVKPTIQSFRSALVDKDKAQWLKNIWNDKNNEQNGNKLRLYRRFKNDIFVETYITTLMPLHHRQNLARLRTGTLPIEIELGR